jgi:hypothetical protein
MFRLLFLVLYRHERPALAKAFMVTEFFVQESCKGPWTGDWQVKEHLPTPENTNTKCRNMPRVLFDPDDA